MCRELRRAEHEGRRQIDGDDVVPLIVLHHHEEVVLGEARVVDEDIEPAAQRLDRLVDELCDTRPVGEVAGHHVNAVAELLGERLELLDLAARDRDRRARPCGRRARCPRRGLRSRP